MSIAIIGSGPAALTAAIYCSRAGYDTFMYEGKTPGGLLMTTTKIENFPGFIGTGPDLIETMYKQASESGTIIIPEQVENIIIAKNFYINSKKYNAVIIATGSSPRLLSLPGVSKFWNKGVSTCAVCDGPLFRNKKVVVVGGGETAAEDSLFLSKFATEVIIVHRNKGIKTSKVLADRVFETKNISIMYESVLTNILGTNTVEAVEILTKNKKSVIQVSAVFMAIGHTPNSDLVKDLLPLQNGYIVTNNTKTSIPGLFACGDVQDPVYRQAIVAAGSGCIASLEAIGYVRDKEKIL